MSINPLRYPFGNPGSYLAPIQEEDKPTVPVHESLGSMYGNEDLSSSPLFAGGLINFGYWKGSIPEVISKAERIESEKNMYRHVLGKLSISQEDQILEVGCGLGIGAALIVEEFHPAGIHCVDFSSDQISRAKSIHHDTEASRKLSFQVGSAESLGLESNKFDRIISIEAAQHFTSLEEFFKESYRVLKPSGKLGVATFFGTSQESYLRVAGKIETVHSQIDHVTPIDVVKDMLQRAGYEDIVIESIGEHVWYGYDRWISQQEGFRDSWNKNWMDCYKCQDLDYYVVVATKK